MKLFLKFFPMALLVFMVSLISVAKVHAQEKTTTRDHRAKAKPRTNTTVPAKATYHPDSVRDHRTEARSNTKVRARRSSKTPKNYQLNAAGKFVPFTPPSSGKAGAKAKSSVDCAIIPCPSSFDKGITCWKCKRSEDKVAPKPGKAKMNE